MKQPKSSIKLKGIKKSYFYVLFCLLFLSDTGNKILSQTLVNETRDLDQLYPDITALNTGNFVVTWTHETWDIPKNIIYAKFFNSTGQNILYKIKINTSNKEAKYSKSILLTTENILFVWCEFSNNPISSEIKAKIISSESTVVRDEFTLVSNYNIEKRFDFFSLKTLKNKFILIYNNFFKIFNNYGDILKEEGNKINENPFVDGLEMCTFPDDKILILYNNNNEKLFGRFGNSEGVLNTNEYFIDAIIKNYKHFYFKCTAIGYNKFIIVYPNLSDLKIKIFSIGFKLLSEILITNDLASGSLNFPSIYTLNDGGFILSYMTMIKPNKFYYQRFDYFGNLVNTKNFLDFQINYELTEDAGTIIYQRTQPKIVQLNNGSIVITFHGAEIGYNQSVYKNDIYLIFVENCYDKNLSKDRNGICKFPTICKEGNFIFLFYIGTYLYPGTVSDCSQCTLINVSNCPPEEKCDDCKSCFDKNTCNSCVKTESSLFFYEKTAITYCSTKPKSGYFSLGGIYYKCMENCLNCANSWDCGKCIEGKIFFN